MERDLYPVGKVMRPHGVRGRVKVDYFGDNPNNFPLYQKIFIRDSSGIPQPYDVLEATPQPPRFILRLKGIEKIEETKDLLGKEVFVQRSDLPVLGPGEYYWFELLGMTVETDQGKRIGTIKEILPTGANDVYVVEGNRGEIFLPATEAVIRNIDREKRVIEVVRMEGLWEDADEV